MTTINRASVGNRFSVVGVAASAVAAAVIGLAAAPALADTTLKVYRSHMPDGTVVLSDRPTAGARTVESSNYVVTEPRQRSTVEAERDYWRRQSEAFDRRQMMRDVGPRGRQWSTRPDHDLAGAETFAESGYQYVGGYAVPPQVSLNRVPRVYESSPGAVRGRDGGFIGSGFSTSR